ncbi:YihY/virulence factor BrkB family protein [Microlunatus soli]|uniref:Membrane protein n=1 Tax=Microlunatus soli TaxID=630515 RepID=A0A1H2AQ07_9ACTN|nr:YihY/virulence factor BrkB family protein [Microlunatus soli]SDT48004.1 membrane protein [Microlunatus soli]
MTDRPVPARHRGDVGDRGRRGLHAVRRILAVTLAACFRNRVTGLAGEAAFFAILSLPPLIFAGVGTLGFVASQIRPAVIQEFRTELLELASRILTPSAVQSVIAPTIDDVLAGGRADVISVGFLIALWSGSRALNVFIDAIGIMYGHQGHRHFVRARLLSFLLYVAFLLVAVVLIPLVLAGPSFVERILPDPIGWLGDLYWPIVLIGSAFFLASLYDVSLPRGYQLRWALPGAGLAMLIWVGGSWALRKALSLSSGTPSVYGPLAAPIALLLWLYLISLAVLIGAAFNSAIDEFAHPQASPEHSVTES